MRRLSRVAAILALAVLAVACGGRDTTVVTVTPGSVPAGSSAEESTAPTVEGRSCADVIAVEVTGDGPFTFSVTVSSPDTGWDKYADEWRIESETEEVLGVRELTHPHVDEQPFTRALSGVEIPAGSEVLVVARDSVEGYCGAGVSVTVGG